jgi:hypothetical protein
MDVQNKNVHNNANEHETRKSEDTNVQEDTECIFCQQTVLNSTNGVRLFCCMLRQKWARKSVLYLTL